MGGKLRIRFPNELWWDEISYESVLNWYDVQVTFLSETTCFVDIFNSANEKIHVELHREDYDKIMEQNALRIKFKLKKHTIL